MRACLRGLSRALSRMSEVIRHEEEDLEMWLRISPKRRWEENKMATIKD